MVETNNKYEEDERRNLYEEMRLLKAEVRHLKERRKKEELNSVATWKEVVAS